MTGSACDPTVAGGRALRVSFDLQDGGQTRSPWNSRKTAARCVHARLKGPQRDKRWLLSATNPLAIAGSVFLMAGISCALYLVADVLYRSSTAGITTAVLVLVILVSWYGTPIAGRLRARTRTQGGRG